MKRLLFVALVCGLAAVPSLGASSLGFWNEGDPGTIHAFWNMESNFVREVLPNRSFDVLPNDVKDFPAGAVPTPIAAAMIIGTNLTYNAEDGLFTSPNPIDVHLKLNNFDAANPFKEIWVDPIGSGIVTPTGALPSPGVLTSTLELLSGPGPGTGADFGWRIRPNPSFEEVVFTIQPASPGVLALLDSIHVDTICIPAPGAFLLASLGAAAVGWLRTRRGL